MAGRIPQSFIDDLVARSDIVELIGSRVPLKKSGREYKACCPFHNEKSPSFWVSPDKQFYHCFGCGAHGTVLGFLMNHDRLSFPEAVVVHQEAERRAVRPAAEAVVELLVGTHPEGGRFLVMERAARLVLAPGLLERHAAADQLDDVGAPDQVVDEMLRNAAGHAA